MGRAVTHLISCVGWIILGILIGILIATQTRWLDIFSGLGT